MFLLRAWSLPGTFLAAAALALLCWNSELSTTSLPGFEFPVQVVRLLVVTAGILLLRPTIDRYREVSVVSPRPLWLLDLGRYAVTASAFALVGMVEVGGGSTLEASPFTALGWLLALGAVTATLLPAYYWIVMFLAGWVWLRLSTQPPFEADLPPAWSFVVVGLGALAYVAANGWLRTMVLRRGSGRG